MSHDPELADLINQAERNLATLELLLGIQGARRIESLQWRIQTLREAYTRETNSLTREVLARAIDRRRGRDRRKAAEPAT
jgi:hypothetical protein